MVNKRVYKRDRQTDRQRELNSNSKTLILKDSSVRSVWAYLTASPCYNTNINKHDNITNKERDREKQTERDRETDTERQRQTGTETERERERDGDWGAEITLQTGSCGTIGNRINV